MQLYFTIVHGSLTQQMDKFDKQELKKRNMTTNKRNQIFCMHLFYNLTETGEFFFTYIKETISYNAVYLILACVV